MTSLLTSLLTPLTLWAALRTAVAWGGLKVGCCSSGGRRTSSVRLSVISTDQVRRRAFQRWPLLLFGNHRVVHQTAGDSHSGSSFVHRCRRSSSAAAAAERRFSLAVNKLGLSLLTQSAGLKISRSQLRLSGFLAGGAEIEPLFLGFHSSFGEIVPPGLFTGNLQALAPLGWHEQWSLGGRSSIFVFVVVSLVLMLMLILLMLSCSQILGRVLSRRAQIWTHFAGRTARDFFDLDIGRPWPDPTGVALVTLVARGNRGVDTIRSHHPACEPACEPACQPRYKPSRCHARGSCDRCHDVRLHVGLLSLYLQLAEYLKL